MTPDKWRAVIITWAVILFAPPTLLALLVWSYVIAIGVLLVGVVIWIGWWWKDPPPPS